MTVLAVRPGTPDVPPWTPSLIVLDVDGTSIDLEQRLHPRVRAAVRQAAQRVPVALATGRMYRSAHPWARDMGISKPLICYQGALIRELPPPVSDGAVIFEEGLSPNLATAVLGLARRRGWYIQAYLDDEVICEEDRPESALYNRIARVPLGRVADLEPIMAGRGSTKLVCIVEDADAALDCLRELADTFGEVAHVTQSLPQFVEVVSDQAGKGPAVQRLCDHLGVDPAMTLAVGDAPNDVSMFHVAGFAVAIATAPEHVLVHADATCPPPERAGLAELLEKLDLAG